ncbi:MAG: glycine--tRNA ligase subunit beta [Betaproteobacteria bacterium]|nr:glycine--tRNA ligase subunit beta [Betaproteobacteria bacterium]MCH9848363.1 glycine--tRNA ligase subunit beta [Betaproteobacteria bacterium]
MTTQNLRDNKANLIVELLVEELPPKALKTLGLSFANVLAASLQSQGLSNVDSIVTNFATPRRLAAHITDVVAKAADEQVAQKLMPVKVGLDAEGKATPALLKRLDGMGLDASAVAKLRTENDGKTDNLFLDMSKTGATLSEGLQKAIEEALAKLPIPKVMSYQINDGWETVNFVRPAHGLIALHGSDVIPVSVLGLSASNTTTGHRFESKKAVIAINNADSYEQQLKDEGAVIASFEARKADIVKQLKAAADKEGLSAIEDDDLLDEVTALVELPNVLLGQYETEFLAVPQECLVLTMKSNQKYFPLLDSNGKLTSKFLIVSNIHPADPSAVIGGNERVVRPRLADAKFFFDQDRKKTLESRIANLDKVVYHNKLGSQGERNLRVVKLAGAIAKQLGDANLVAKAEQAARLSKADLITDMVNEFPELQGIMGRYYAQHEGLDDAVAFAIEDHYKPRFAGDELPRSQVGICVALADKLETLVGLFSIGEKPTGDKDPFALRRQALGIIRMLIDAKLPLSFDSLIQLALQQFDGNVEVLASIKSFCFDRLSVNLKDQGASAQEVDAVLSLEPALLHEIPQRLAAVQTFATLAEAPALAAANKRVGNILRKVDGEVAAKVDNSLLQEETEKALAAALNTSKAEADKLFEAGDYTGSLQALAVLKAPVDDFFDNVMVNADDPALKANRLGLLATLHQAMNRVADLSKLAS